MAEQVLHIEGKDCLPFQQRGELDAVLNFILKQEQVQTFHFSPNYEPDSDEAIVGFDFRERQWKAGRYVGEMDFTHNGQQYKLTIKPRFGELFLFRMLEEIFNIRILPSLSKEISKTDWKHYIKRIVSFVWLHKLAASNRYGIPKQNKYPEYRGSIIRGRLNVRKSFIPYYTSKEVITNNYEKQEYEIVARIIWQANQILAREFDLGMFKIPDAAKDALDHFTRVKSLNNYVSESDYRNIQLKGIYQNWKPIIDFSWDILKSKPFRKEQSASSKSYSFFIDMAEVWELYIGSLLRKQLMLSGWTLKNEKLFAYPEHHFKRQLIPDIVFERDDEIVVWDAKYKMMQWRPFDFDRSDFFQIHTYIHYYQQNKKVKCGGLLYPLSVSNNYYEKAVSQSLFGSMDSNSSTSFIADGIDLSFCDSSEIKPAESLALFQKMEKEFLKRIDAVIEN